MPRIQKVIVGPSGFLGNQNLVQPAPQWGIRPEPGFAADARSMLGTRDPSGHFAGRGTVVTTSPFADGVAMGIKILRTR